MGNIVLSLQSIWRHKTRSLLTMLGIIIGIASIITIVSVIQGSSEQLKESLVGSDNNVVTVALTTADSSGYLEEGAKPQGVTQPEETLLQELAGLSHVEALAFYHSREYVYSVYFRNTQQYATLYGIGADYPEVCGLQVCRGRGLTAADLSEARKVALVDSRMAERLFAGEEPIGQTLEIGGEVFTVVGVLEQAGSDSSIDSLDEYYLQLYGSSSSAVFLPDSCWPLLYGFDEPVKAAVRADSADSMAEAGNAVADRLTEALVTDGEYCYRAEGLLDQEEALETLTDSASLLLISIAGISLLVGGIGVMNIMLVSVAERTREIGLKKAIGARRRRILGQFLTEAGVLTGLGGIIGVLSGLGLARLMSSVLGLPASVNVPACVIAVAFSTLIGLVFGLVPAVKAARLRPIEALRSE